MRIRSGIESDLSKLVEIYNHYVEHTHVTFDTRPFGVDERRVWFHSFAESGPHRLLVAEADSEVLGYACSGRLRPKPAYDRSVETTIYLDPSQLGGGIGRNLYQALLALLERETDVHRAYGAIALPNGASIALHESLGFRHLGTYREVGYKFHQYWDVSWYEKALS